MNVWAPRAAYRLYTRAIGHILVECLAGEATRLDEVRRTDAGGLAWDSYRWRGAWLLESSEALDVGATEAIALVRAQAVCW